MKLVTLIAMFTMWKTACAFVTVASQSRVRTTGSPNRQSVAWSTSANPAEQAEKLATVEKQAAVEALEKLLARQRNEIADTERLLKSLTNPGEDEALDEHLYDRAESILSGFDYGFVSRSEGAPSAGLSGGFPVENLESKGAAFEKYGPPANIVVLGLQQFWRNGQAMMGEYKDEEDVALTEKQKELQHALTKLTLNSTAVWERESASGPIEAPYVILIPYNILCWLLDVVFEGRYVPSRFFLLETVARMPYFSYITMLHLYETLGFWRRSSDVKRIHFAEEWNEFNHLLIMESLGGDQRWLVRFISQHSAIVYFVVLSFLWALSPTLAYKFSELLESHAVNTYGQFADENKELLEQLPPSMAAIRYYSFGGSDPLFGEYQTSALAAGGEIRRPGDNMKSLYDVFCAIRDDEGDHVGTMKACLDPNVAVQSSSLERKVLIGAALAVALSAGYAMGDFPDLTSFSGVADGMGGLADSTVVDAAVGGAAGFFSQFLEDDEQLNAVGAAEEFFEAGTIGVILESARRAFVQVLIKLAELLAALL